MADVNPTRFEDLPTYPESKQERHEKVVYAVIETPAKTRHKYALNPEFGALELRATLAEGLAWPYDYGFIPQTRGGDGDPLDILFLCDVPTFPGCLVKARILGIVHLSKDGQENDRILGCAMRMDGVAQSTDAYDDVDDLPKAQLQGICRFLVEYSEEQGHKIEFKGTSGVKGALKAIEYGRDAFRDKRRK
jgi:inorganic pyrophosphatase